MQDGHDAQHTGATTEQPWESWSYAWSWNGPDATGGAGGNTYRAPEEARTVMGGGHMYVPAGAKGLYALNLSDGSVAWRLASPAFNATPAYDPATGAVFAGGADGSLYKIDSGTGRVLATHASGAPINKSVALNGTAAYVVNARGELHRVDTGTMAMTWVYNSGCTVQCELGTPPAYSPSRDAIIFATGDLFVHAVKNVDGTRKWKLKPTPNPAQFPFTFSRGWPVIAEKHGLVFLRMQTDDNLLFGPMQGGMFPNGNAAVRSYLQANPQAQTVFAFRLDDGSTPFLPAVGFGSVDGLDNNNAFYRLMPGQPVVKLWPNGDEVVYIQFRDGSTNPPPPDGRWDSHMGEMMLDSTTTPGLGAGDMRFVQMARYGNEGGNAYTFITDEQYPLTIAGSSILYSNYEGLNSAQITNRTGSRGTSYTNQISTVAHPPLLRQLSNSCLDFNPLTHFASCTGLTSSLDGRFWDGPGFWEFWNIQAPGPFLDSANQWRFPFAPRYSYVSNGLIVFEGEVGDLFVLRHASSPPPGAITNPNPLYVSTVTTSATSVPQYDKIELTFQVGNSVATNLQFPYDPAPPTGLTPGAGITVNAQALPPGQTDWSQAVVQPAFLYQDYQRQQIGTQQWLYPQGRSAWKVRFAPTQQGTWQVRVATQDASVCAPAQNPCTSWIYSSPLSFNVSAPRANQHGFLSVSPTDNRYFNFSDGTPFFGQGISEGFGGNTYVADAALATEGANGVNLLRIWMSGQAIAGSSWAPWWVFGAPGYGGYLPESGLQNAPAGSGRDFVFDLNAAAGRRCILNGFTQGQIGVKHSTTYQLTTTVKVSGLAAAQAGQPSGFGVKVGDWPVNNACPEGLTQATTVIADTGNTADFTTLTGTYTTSGSQDFLGNLYLILDNASAGGAMVSQVSLKEVLSDRSLGPELLSKGNSDMHTDFNQIASWEWDHTIDQAAQNGVYLKLVVLEKNDRVWNRIKPDGTLGTNDTDNFNFHAAANTKVRSLQQYYWRYLTARWGYSTAVHSWELLNEGSGVPEHAAQADAMAQYIHQLDPNRHMVSTSLYAGFPVDTFWANPQYRNIDFADVHAYVSTGLGSYEWSEPSGTTRETDTANLFNGQGGAIKVPAGVTSGGKDLSVRGQGDWQISVLIKADQVAGTCPYNGSPSLAGPHLQVAISGVTTRSIPYDPNEPDKYYICTAPAGTYGYTQFTGTITVPDGNWHTLTLSFLNNFATSGTAWFTNLVVRSPDGRIARIYGDGTFGDRVRMDYDTALFNQIYGLVDGARSISGAGKPLIRGETGIDYSGGPQTELPQLAQDRRGVWLHNYLWGALNPTGMYDIYFWPQNIRTNNLYFHYKPVLDFVAGLPLANGQYQDAQAVAASQTVGVLGQKDLTNKRAHLWIRSINHTWWNVVNGGTWGNLTGTVQVSGFASSGWYSAEWWAFDTDGNLAKSTQKVQADPSGLVTLDLASLANTTTDAGVKLAPTSPPPTVTPTPTSTATATPTSTPTSTPTVSAPVTVESPTPTNTPAPAGSSSAPAGTGSGSTPPTVGVPVLNLPTTPPLPVAAGPLPQLPAPGAPVSAPAAPSGLALKPLGFVTGSLIPSLGGRVIGAAGNLDLAFFADSTRPDMTVQTSFIDSASLPAVPAELQSGSTAFIVHGTAAGTGQPVGTLASPFLLTYRPVAAELEQAGGDLARIHLVALSDDGWIALPCTANPAPGTIECTSPQLRTFASVITAQPAAPLETDVLGGRFFRQGNGFSGAGSVGFSVVDDAEASFWTAYQSLGGAPVVGYPISRRFVYRGFLTQAFQKMALQWRPDMGNSVVPVNVLDDLSSTSTDAWLNGQRQVPPAADQTADLGLSFDAVTAQHTALLSPYPQLEEFYRSQDNAVQDMGLVLGVADYGTFVGVRLQRATLQLWRVSVPWARSGQIVVGNAGDLAKETGLWPDAALIPEPAPAGPPPAVNEPAPLDVPADAATSAASPSGGA